MIEPYPCAITTDARMRQLDVGLRPEKGFLRICGQIERLPGREVAPHWHNEIEILTVRKGRTLAHVGHETLVLKPGEGIVVNAGALHQFTLVQGFGCIYDTFIFTEEFLGGPAESEWLQRYIRPLTRCETLPAIPLRGHIPWEAQLDQSLREAFITFDEGAYGCELVLRAALTQLWLTLSQHHGEEIQRASGVENRQTRRLKAMMDFIAGSYADPLTLSDIAAVADIGERECLRCFSRSLGMPPMQYLTKVRLSHGAQLLWETDQTITSIASACGFDNPGYFSRCFKKWMGQTPVVWRREKAAQGLPVQRPS